MVRSLTSSQDRTLYTLQPLLNVIKMLHDQSSEPRLGPEVLLSSLDVSLRYNVHGVYGTDSVDLVKDLRALLERRGSPCICTRNTFTSPNARESPLVLS